MGYFKPANNKIQTLVQWQSAKELKSCIHNKKKRKENHNEPLNIIKTPTVDGQIPE